VLRGYNGTILAYGQTGSGKTHTMLGPPALEEHGQGGVIPHAMTMILESLAAHKASPATDSEMRVSCSFIEIYQEEVQDLLVSRPTAGGPYPTLIQSPLVY